MSDNIVYGKTECVYADENGKVRVHVDEPWDASDPFVKAHPELFSDVPEEPQKSGPSTKRGPIKSTRRSK